MAIKAKSNITLNVFLYSRIVLKMNDIQVAVIVFFYSLDCYGKIVMTNHMPDRIVFCEKAESADIHRCIDLS